MLYIYIYAIYIYIYIYIYIMIYIYIYICSTSCLMPPEISGEADDPCLSGDIGNGGRGQQRLVPGPRTSAAVFTREPLG